MDVPDSKAPEPTRAGRDAKTSHVIGVVFLIVFLASFLALVHWHYPQVGHDYRFVFAMLFEDAWNLSHGGLAIPRYAVHLCGGSVLYGHPLDMFYSLVHPLAWVTDPWIAVVLTMLAAFVLGYIGWYRVGRDLVGLPSAWAHLLALVVVANGFHFMHLLAGHFTYHGFPLLGWLVWLLFERRPKAASAHLAKRATAFGLLCAYLMYSGNWVVLFFFALACVLLLPLDILVAFPRRRRLVELGLRAAVFASVALALCASKLVAVWSFIRHFPRVMPLEAYPPGKSVLTYVVHALWAVPQRASLFVESFNFVHEQSMLCSPVTLVGLALALVALVMGLRKRHRQARARIILFSVLYGGAMLVAMLQLVGGQGWFATTLHALPLGSSQHVSARYLYLFSLLISVAGVWGCATVLRFLPLRKQLIAVAAAALVTVMTFVAGYGGMLSEVGLWETASDYRASWKKLGAAPQVSAVVPYVDFFAGSVQNCYEPILNGSGKPYEVLHLGSVFDRNGGHFNFMNPACYQYPEENRCSPGDRVRVEDAENLNRLMRGDRVGWRISRLQRFADLLSGLSLGLGLVAWVVVARYGRRRHPRRLPDVGP